MREIATWGQLPDESEKAYASFKVYRNAGTQRSLRKTARLVGKGRTLMERWSKRHGWLRRVAAWDLEQQDLHKEARIQAISDAEERHGKLARALLGRVAAELGAQVKGRCTKCGRSPTQLTAAQVSTALKAGVEVERLALGQVTAGASSITQSMQTNVSASSTTALVLLRDPESQRLASDLLSRMHSLDPATSLRRLAGAQAAAALRQANGKGPTGHAAVKAAQAQVLVDRQAIADLEADPSAAALAVETKDEHAEAAFDEAQRETDEKAERRRASRSRINRRVRERYAAERAAGTRPPRNPKQERLRTAERKAAAAALANDDVDLF